MRLLGWLVAAAVTARALTACGGDDETATEPGNIDGGAAKDAALDGARTKSDSASSSDGGTTGPADADSGSAVVADADAEAALDADAAPEADASPEPDADADADAPLTPGAHLAVGFGTACAIDAVGVLECWGGAGSGGGGQLTPTIVAPGTTWNEISAGRTYCGIQTNGSLWCWNPGATPTQPDTGKFLHVSTGDGHSCAITPARALYCWGNNNNGQLGIGDEDSHEGLQLVGDSDWASVSAGDGHTCGIKTGGDLYCWGNNTWGQVYSGATYKDVTSPTQIMAGTLFSEVSAGDNATCARRKDGALFCWGTLGDAQNKPPKRIDTATDWAQTSSHGSHDCTLKTDGALYCFGGNTYGQIGVVGSNTGSPTLVAAGTTWSEVAAGDWTTCARKSDGSVWCWGAGMYGQLGLGAPYGPHLSPTQVTGSWKSVSAGNVTVCGVRDDGTIACWGLVINVLPSSSTFLAQAPVTIDSATNWDSAQVSANASLCARQTDGSLWCKKNGNPFVTTGLNVTKYAHGESHTCAITPTQALYCWGANDQGQVGLPADAGTTIASPAQVGSDTWLDVSVDYSATCGVRTDGTAWCWGNGSPTMTQVGTSTTWTSLSVYSGREGVNGGGLFTWSGNNTPTPLGTATDWAKVTNGLFFSCATKTDGTLHCWGSNSQGQLGDGTTASHSLPAPVTGSATNWSYATIGNSSTCGLRADKSLYCWGDNTWAMMGDNSAWVPTPTQVIP